MVQEMIPQCERILRQYRLRPKALLSLPVSIAPSGWHQLAQVDGEAVTARATNSCGTAMGVSMATTMASEVACSPEEVKSAGGNT